MNESKAAIGCYIAAGSVPILLGLYLIYKAKTVNTGGDIANSLWAALGIGCIGFGGLMFLAAFGHWLLARRRNGR
jgi:hypothetical protein